MTLTEDGTTNQIEESLNLFQAICVNKFFKTSSFLNKLDSFTEKINNTNHHLQLFFPQYNGPDHDMSAAMEFISSQFLARNLDRSKIIILTLLTMATDTSDVKVRWCSGWH